MDPTLPTDPNLVKFPLLGLDPALSTSPALMTDRLLGTDPALGRARALGRVPPPGRDPHRANITGMGVAAAARRRIMKKSPCTWPTSTGRVSPKRRLTPTKRSNPFWTVMSSTILVRGRARMTKGKTIKGKIKENPKRNRSMNLRRRARNSLLPRIKRHPHRTPRSRDRDNDVVTNVISKKSEGYRISRKIFKSEGGREGREGGGRRPNRPNRPANREPGPLDPDYDNGEDWGEMENWRDQFRESENMSQRGRENGTSGGRPRENGNGGGRDRENGGRNTPPRNTPRLDCSDRADGAGGAPRMYPNPDDCATYFTCNMRRPVLTYCPRGLNYNPRRRGCDDSEPSNCRTVRASQTPADVFIYNRRLHQIVNDSKSSSEEEIALPTRR
uniref:Putative endochitinase n=1 Tax=Lygus hesperus TaxID=30085 RepID=A0A0A9XQH3_LYGHE